MLELNEGNFNETIGSKQVVLVDFFANWCGPCHRLNPILDKLSEEFSGRATIAKVNHEENPDLTANYKVSAIPMLFLFKNGTLVKKMLGLQSEQVLRDELNKLL